jgi:hypothetical protein
MREGQPQFHFIPIVEGLLGSWTGETALDSAAANALIRGRLHPAWLGLLVVLFAENGLCRAVIESLSGAEAAALGRPGQLGAAFGALRFWKPIGIVTLALAGSLIGLLLRHETYVSGAKADFSSKLPRC